MNILVVGGGGREDALCWRLSRDPGVEVACTPGNPGTARWGENMDGPPEAAAARRRPDLVVVGPEAPLADGLADRLRAGGLAVFGPGADGARLEASKSWAKALMERAGIPTARARAVATRAEALAALRDREALGLGRPDRPIVLKADGLAAGKGVVVARDEEEARRAVDALLPAEGGRAVVEEFLEGREASVLAVTDGRRFRLLPGAEDHKTLLDGDRGPNTGGMGAISPTPVLDSSILRRVETEVFEPLLAALRGEGVDFRGIVYAGLMVRDGRPRVLEFNCRFGDPEAQAILPRVTGNLSGALRAAAEGAFDPTAIGEAPGACAAIVAAARGYPEAPEVDRPIEGPVLGSSLHAPGERGEIVFVAGARRSDDRLVTSGGRVLSAVGAADGLDAALEAAYGRLGLLWFDGMRIRRDVGRRGRRARRLGEAPSAALRAAS